jgi:hypothetical protein
MDNKYADRIIAIQLPFPLAPILIYEFGFADMENRGHTKPG